MNLKNLRIYFILILTNNFWFITSNWLNFWLKYMSLREVGIIDAIAFLIGVMIEFPSGVLSDRLGRKQALLLSQSLQLLGSLLITFSSTVLEIGIGFVIFQLGVAFYSGTVEAFGYETSLSENINYDKTLVKSGFISNFSYLTALVLGGYLYVIDNDLPNILFSLNFVLGIIFCLLINDYRIDPEVSNNKVPFLKNLNLKIIGLFILLMSVSFAFDYGFLKLVILENFSNLNNNYWYIFIATLTSLVLSSFFLSRLSSYYKPIFIVILFFLIASLIGIYNLIPLFFVLSFMAVFIYQISLKYLNDRVSDTERASVISLFNLCYKLPYVLIALVLGYNLA